MLVVSPNARPSWALGCATPAIAKEFRNELFRAEGDTPLTSAP